MSRRTSRRNTWIAIAMTPLVLAVWASALYVGWMNRQMSRVIVSKSWRHPIEIWSEARPDAKEPVLEVYAPDWRAADPVRLDELPDHVANAFIAAEDVRFRRHFGVDPVGMLRAAVRNLRAGGITQGGSTIDQQLIKSMMLSNDRTFRRKALEAVLAVILDVRLTKDEILEAYLNEVYLGHQRGRAIRGIDEGARLFYGKDPEDLTAAEAALIASIIPAPNRDTPEKRPETAKRRRDVILERMRERDWIDGEEYDAAIKTRARFRPSRLAPTPYLHYLAAVRREVEEQIGERRAATPGLKIVAGLDPRMQKEAEEAVRSGVRRLRASHRWLRTDEDSLQAALLSLDPESGIVRALVSGADPGSTGMDRTADMRRQPGSAFKPFVYLAAIRSRKLTTASLLLDAPLRIQLDRDDAWEPHNYDQRFRGRVTLREAFEKSLNVPAVRVAQKIGSGSIVEAARDSGFDGDIDRVPALPLGVAEVNMRELAGAYTVFPSLGDHVEPFLVASIRDEGGNELYRHEVKRRQATDPASAYVVHSLLRGVVRRGTASRLRRYGMSHAAGKTGTTSDYRDAWFVGYTPDVVTSVWVGFDRGTPLRLSSAEAAIPIWGSYMREIPTSRNELDPPEGVTFRNIDPESGWVWETGCPGPVKEVFLDGTAPTRECPRGFFGRIVRKVLFDDEGFDEPAAITFDQFRQWAHETDQQRQRVEGWVERIRRIFD